MSTFAFQSSSSSSSSGSSSSAVFMQPCRGNLAGGGRLPMAERRGGEEEEDEEEGSCSSSSSIGRNSDEESDEDCGETEVESSFKGPLDTMDALAEVLPIKRGISNFYNGKSKSFTSLADVSSASSIKDIAKPSYNRKRKNLLVHNNCSDKNLSFPPTGKGSGFSKKSADSSKSILSPVLDMSHPKSADYTKDTHMILSSPRSCLPPVHPLGRTSLHNGACARPIQKSSPWRSFSVSDLCSAANH